ncbi:cytoplasmic protein NCK2-like isoform X2 [Acanthaster planci]|uniref:Cytoplasmic protein NCK2-like isoform X2 n=1 Tax=Acanthaster planci TaxID=133434 RepID=A0A8B7Z1G4_ACAPL|nr:cytoplasmic protein NCK2-like isoform X2 [Acanthaster planci]
MADLSDSEADLEVTHILMSDEEIVYVIAKWDYTANQQEELNIRKNERLTLIDDTKSWWKVRKASGDSGYVPSNFVKKEKKSFMNKLRDKIVPSRDTKQPGMGPLPHATEHGQRDLAESAEFDQLCVPAKVLYNYVARQPDELSLRKGEKLTVLEKSGDGWWRGECNGETGWFPSNYVNEEGDSLPASQKSSVSSKGDENVLGEDYIHTVIALYKFQGRNDEELNFEQGERLDILQRPEDDPEWWKARNTKGEIGLVPKNYVEEITANAQHVPVSNPVISNDVGVAQAENGNSLKHKIWFCGTLKRDESERTLMELNCEDGTFLIRESETTPGGYSVSVKAPDKIKHFKVQRVDDQYCIGSKRFESLDYLIEHYKKAPIFSCGKTNFKLYLTKPYREVCNNGGAHYPP